MTQVPNAGPFPPASDAMDAAYRTVEKALNRTNDALAGFETMVEKAEPAFRPVAERFRALHARHAAALTRLLTEAGRTPDTDGTLMGTVNQAVVATRAFFDRIDSDVLTQVLRGEESVTDAYRAALDAPLSSPEHDVVTGLLTELQTLVAETRALA